MLCADEVVTVHTPAEQATELIVTGVAIEAKECAQRSNTKIPSDRFIVFIPFLDVVAGAGRGRFKVRLGGGGHELLTLRGENILHASFGGAIHRPNRRCVRTCV